MHRISNNNFSLFVKIKNAVFCLSVASAVFFFLPSVTQAAELLSLSIDNSGTITGITDF